MNAKTNYIFVGSFVLLSAVLMVFFIIWSLQLDNKGEVQEYHIEFSESVSGLNVDSPVKYRGVTVGKVHTIYIKPDDVEKITVLIGVDKYTPIKIDTVAELKPQGITGLRFVDLSQGSKTSALLETRRNDVPLIPSVPSFFVMLEHSFGLALKNITESAARLKELFGEENQKQIERILRHSANISASLDAALSPEYFEEMNKMVISISSLATHLDENTPELKRVLKSGDAFSVQAKHSIASLQESFASMSEVMRVFNARNKNGDYSVKEHVGPSMRQFEMTMHDMQSSLILLNQILIRYGESPSDILFEHQLPMVGPGERR